MKYSIRFHCAPEWSLFYFVPVQVGFEWKIKQVNDRYAALCDVYTLHIYYIFGNIYRSDYFINEKERERERRGFTKPTNKIFMAYFHKYSIFIENK